MNEKILGKARKMPEETLRQMATVQADILNDYPYGYAFYSASTGMVCVSLGSERHVNPDTRYEFHISKVLFIAPSKIINY